jgi:hypothetical protein
MRKAERIEALTKSFDVYDADNINELFNEFKLSTELKQHEQQRKFEALQKLSIDLPKLTSKQIKEHNRTMKQISANRQTSIECMLKRKSKQEALEKTRV